MWACLERLLRSAAVAAAAALITLSPAKAIVYSGEWDPLFGDPFTSSPLLGWSGTVKVDVPPLCVGADRLFLPTNSCGVPTVLHAQVELYDASNGNAPLGAPLDFDESSMRILGLDFTGSALDWVWTLPSNWVYSSAVNKWFSLAFLTPQVSDILDVFIPELRTTPGPYGGPVLLASDVDVGAIPISRWSDVLTSLLPAVLRIDVSNVAVYPPDFVGGSLFGAGQVTDIPEPGSLALVALALVATGWVARSRRRR